MDLSAGRSLVERWRAGHGSTAPNGDEPTSLTAAQRGVWVFEGLYPGKPIFNVSFAARHSGTIDRARLDAAVAALIRRHANLRSTFEAGPEGPVRTVHADLPYSPEWTDLRHLPAQQRWDTAERLADQITAEPFDLGRGPLIRVHVIRVDDEEHVLVLVAHHMVCDGESVRVLLRELDIAYEGGELPGAEPVAVPPKVDEATYQYWMSRLANLPALDLPTDHGRAAQPSFHAGSVPLTLPEDLVVAAERLGRQENATLFMVLLAAFQLLMGKHSGQTDFAVSSPETGRTRPGMHDVVALLANPMVLRTDLSGSPSFRELVRRARTTFLEAFPHRDAPFDELITRLAPGHGLDRAPLIGAYFVFHGEYGDPRLAGASLEPMVVQRPALRHDVELHLWRRGDGLWGNWDFNAEVFERATAARMAERLRVLLTAALADPDVTVDRLDIRTDEERELLARWSAGPAAPADPVSRLHDLVTEQARRSPDAIAVTDGRRDLTYAQLEARSNQMAHHLRAQGVRPRDKVGIQMKRSADLLVAMLGILKTGAAYLPLDPAYPADRVEYMRDDSAATMVLTEVDHAALDRQPTSPVEGVDVGPSDLAYILYTSGSTGRPKGVMLTHRSAVALMRWGLREFTTAELRRVLAGTSICFDVSVFELFAPLCAGGTVVVVEDVLVLLTPDAPDVTMVSMVPAAAREMVAAGALPKSVKNVLLGGEALPGAVVDGLYDVGKVEGVYNMYGPTEDTTYSTYANVPRGEEPPIGWLLPNEHAYVLDAALRPVPIGVVGELYLAGEGLARGYGNQPGMTASRFVANPVSPTPGQRMYRTGDLVRYRADGALLYLGRQDFQVKVRGQRIELGEIEATMQRHPEVRDAVVTMYGDRLVGYVTARGPEGVGSDDVRDFLRQRLPSIMVPTHILVLDALPKTPNGKVDRRALPAPVIVAGAEGGPPQGRAEKLVAEVWQEVLELDEVGRDDDFFELGGHSLHATSVVAKLRTLFGVEVSVRQIFELRTVRQLAAGLAPSRPLVTPRPPDAEPVTSFDQQRMWMEDQLRPTVSYNIHVRQRLIGDLDVEALERSIRAIIARHETLRTRFPLVDGKLVQVVDDVDDGWRISYEDVSGRGDDRDELAERLADRQSTTSFDLANGPLFDCLLVKLGDNEHLLSLTIHHIVFDGWSIRLFLQELTALYPAGGDVDKVELPELPIQYRDFAVWQRNWLRGETLTKLVGYWRRHLAGAPAALELPVARRRTAQQGATGGRVRTQITSDEAEVLRTRCREYGVTPFMMLLASLATVLRRWSGQDDLVIGAPATTRGDAATSGLIGLFVNTLPLRIDLTGDPSFVELLRRVRQVALDGYAYHGEVPFDVLVGELQVPRDPTRTPLVQVILNMVDTAEDDWQLPGVRVEFLDRPVVPSMFDVNLSVYESSRGYQLDLAFHRDRYDEATMQALLDQFRTLLSGVVDDPTRGILEYPLQAGEPAPVAEPAAVPDMPALPAAVARHATRSPDRIAVVDADGRYTYAQLHRAALGVAHALAGAGSDGGEVGVVARRSANFVAAVLGCRLTGAPVVGVNAAPSSDVATALDPDGASIDVRALLTAPNGTVPAAREPLPEPPGEHTDWAVDRFELTGEDRIAVLSGSPGQLMSAVSTALTAGATLYLPDEATTRDPAALVEWLGRHAVTVVYVTPPALRALATRGGAPRLPMLRYVFVDSAGELMSHDVELVRRIEPSCRVVGTYRLTRTGRPTAVHVVPDLWSAADSPLRLPVGTQADGIAVELVNPVGQPTSVGEVGEILLGGQRTGDLGRRLPDGTLEFAGRVDAKTGHGDPIEVVATLRDLPEVADAVVTGYADADGRTEYTAYVACPGGGTLNTLRQHVTTRVPKHLAPQRIVVLDRLPLTPSGEYDLAALSRPDEAGAANTGTQQLAALGQGS
ncbi:MAG TPA: amino acid adenylation domain-containing protein [Micromonosporaceae bacterium]